MNKLLLATLALAAICACGSTKTVVGEKPEDDSVNIGYTTVSKNAMTDAGNSLKVSERDSDQYNSMLDYLRDRVPGIEIDGNSIMIRGMSSLQGSSDPLIMFDGAEIMDITMIDPREVYSVDVLKDSGAAMYGVKGTNGVIIIKSKATHLAEEQAREARKAEKALKKKK